ncbi:MAG: hypothetical protein IPL49_07895 [Saprospirales bacterium]|nr:hypothetical protein [Saprospirales bacterium]
MKKFIGIVAIACIPFMAAAQYTQEFQGCPDTEVFTTATTPAFFGKSSDDLQTYFSEKLQPIIDNQSPKGDMQLTVLIDADGTPCLQRFTLDGEVRMEPNHIKNIVDGMEGWKAAMQDNRPVAYHATIDIRFKGSKVVASLVK